MLRGGQLRLTAPGGYAPYHLSVVVLAGIRRRCRAGGCERASAAGSWRALRGTPPGSIIPDLCGRPSGRVVALMHGFIEMYDFAWMNRFGPVGTKGGVLDRGVVTEVRAPGDNGGR